MPLQFNPPADPLTSLTSTPPDERFRYETKPDAVSPVIESDALQRLTKEIERYGRHELAGRSILIAGHRGVGKTTLVRKAIENVRRSSSRFGGRPLFVDLHGPDLLAPPDKETAGKPRDAKPGETAKNGKAVNTAPQGDNEPEAGGGDPSAEVEKNTKQTGAEASNSGNNSQAKQPSGADLQSFVERLTFSLYRAAAKEFVESFRALHAQSDDWKYAELATQFALELDGSTDLGRIRLLYERVGAFVNGVLQTSGSSSGSQELALLAASSQAYRIISGELAEKTSAEASGKNTVNWSITADNLLSPVTGLLAGALAWAALPADFGPLAKLFTSFTAGLASAIAVKFTRTVQRESKESREVTFVPQRDKLALRRLLPVLVDRFCDLGLPPIFVVDELDKVADISKRMEGLMGFLKQFVTERAFFCFLVNRDYYETLEATVSTSAFPIEATLFGDRLFVQYAPESFHTYLKNTTEVGTLAVGESQDDAARDLDVLRYVLLRRSYMHPFDLRREISRSTNAKNEFRFPHRALFNVRQYRNEVYYQVAVECVLTDEKLLDFAEDPNRAQLLYDALYFPIRTKKPPAEFDGSRDSLKEHLAGRMGKENGKLLSEEDLNIVHGALSELVGFLCTPRALLDTIQALAAKHVASPKVFPHAAVGVIESAVGEKLVEAAGSPAGGANQSPEAAGERTGLAGPTNGPTPPSSTPASPPPPPIGLAKAEPLLEQGTGTERRKYRWRFDKYGYAIAPDGESDNVETKFGEVKAVTGSVEPEAWVASLLGAFEEAVELLATKQGTAIDIELWERMRLIRTPPTWSYVREAADALRNPASFPATKVDEYKKALIEYQANLISARKAIWSAVAIAATMAVHDKSKKGERRSLEILAEVLAETSSRDEMLKQVEEIAQEATRDFSSQAAAVQENASYGKMLADIDASAGAVRGRTLMAAPQVAMNSATFYDNWFVQFYEGRQPPINSLWPFLSFVMQSLPFGLQYVNPLRMTIADWTKASLGPPSPQRVLGLERLGFRRLAATEADRAFSEPEDSLRRALQNSIRKRWYEQASVILQPLPDTLTRGWFPSEKIACRIASSARDLLGSNAADLTEIKYVLLELEVLRDSDVQKTVDNIIQDFAKLTAVPKTAFFGSGIPTTAMPRGYPYVPDPRSLDDLVEILDARPASDWASSAGPLA